MPDSRMARRSNSSTLARLGGSTRLGATQAATSSSSRCADSSYGDCEAHWLPAGQSAGRHGGLTTSRRISSSTARAARSGSSAAAEDHSSDPAPTPRYLASAQGEARPVASARPGSGRSRFASHRRRIRLEARGQARAALRPHDSVQHSSPPRVEAVEKLRCGTAVARWAFEAGGPATLRRSAWYEVTRTGDVRKKPRKERELLSPFPNVCLRLAVRTAPPYV